MAEASAIGNVYELRVLGKLENQDCINVLHFQALEDGRDIVTDLLIVAYICFVEQLVPHLATQYRLDKMEVKRVAPTLGPVWEYAGETGDILTGAAEGDGLPSFVSVRTDIRCVRGGRSGKGSIAIGGVPEAATVGSTIVTGGDFWTGFQAWLDCVRNAFLQGFGFGTKHFLIGVVSRKLGASKPPYTTAQFSVAVSMTAKPKVGSQVSRKIGHGR